MGDEVGPRDVNVVPSCGSISDINVQSSSAVLRCQGTDYAVVFYQICIVKVRLRCNYQTPGSFYLCTTPQASPGSLEARHQWPVRYHAPR